MRLIRITSFLLPLAIAGGCGVMSAEDRSEGARLMTEEMQAREEMLARREESLRLQETAVRERENQLLGNEPTGPQRLIVRLPNNAGCVEAVWSGKPTAPIETADELSAMQSLELLSPQQNAIIAPVGPTDPTNPTPHLVWRTSACP